MKTVILAAGKGTRMKPLTDNMPKAMVLLHGKPFLEHVLVSLKQAGIKEAVIVVGYLKEKIIDYFGTEFMGIKIEYAVQKKQLGTAHAVLQAKKFLKKDFLVGHSDIIAEPSVWRALLKANGFDVIAVVREDAEAEKFGVVETEGNRIVSVEEKPLKPKSNLVLAGFYRFSPKVFSAIEKLKKSPRGELELTDAINFLAQKKKAGFVKFGGKIFDIGSLQDLKKAEKEFL